MAISPSGRSEVCYHNGVLHVGEGCGGGCDDFLQSNSQELRPPKVYSPRPAKKKSSIFDLSEDVKLVIKTANKEVDIRQHKNGNATKHGIELNLNKYKRLCALKRKIDEELTHINFENAESIVGWHSLANDVLVRSGIFMVGKSFTKGVDIRHAKGTQSAAKDMIPSKKGLTLTVESWNKFSEIIGEINEVFEIQ